MHHLEQVAVQLDLLALLGQVAEGVHHQTADRIHLFIAELGAEEVVEILDLGEGAHREDPFADAADLFRLVFDVVEFVVNLADDELKDVLDGHQAGDAAELVHHDGHVVALFAKLLEQPVDPLALGHDHRGAQDILQLQRLAGVVAAEPERQQILGEQDALHVILVLVDHREAGVARLDDHRQDLVHRLGFLDGHHLGAGNHDVAHAQLGNFEHPLDHVLGVLIDEVPLFGIGDDLYQIVAVFWLALEELAEFVEPGFLRRAGTRVIVGHFLSWLLV